MKKLLVFVFAALLASFGSGLEVDDLASLGYSVSSIEGGIDLSKPVILSFSSKGSLGIADGLLSVKDGRLIVEKRTAPMTIAGRSPKSVKASFSVEKKGFSFLASGDALEFSKEGRYAKIKITNGALEGGFSKEKRQLLRCYKEDCTLELYVSNVEKLRPFAQLKGTGYIAEKDFIVKDKELKKVIEDGFYSEHIIPLRDLTAIGFGERDDGKDAQFEVYASFAEKTSMLNHATMTTLNPKGLPIPVQFREHEGFEGKYFQVKRVRGDTLFTLLSSGWGGGSLALKDSSGGDVLRMHEGRAIVAPTCAGKVQACLSVNSVKREAQVVLAGKKSLVKMNLESGYRLNILHTEAGAGMVYAGSKAGSLQLSHNSVKVSPRTMPWYELKMTFTSPMKGKMLFCDSLSEKCLLDGKDAYLFLKKRDLSPRFEERAACSDDEVPKPLCDPGISDRCFSRELGRFFMFNPKTKCWVNWEV
ncbi:hypothetical protein HY501_00640 [Candidatus Woesearchaeota archaeon]|nr:hypothetical protein [Candidatus Woesearchaeota archaeon]